MCLWFCANLMCLGKLGDLNGQLAIGNYQCQFGNLAIWQFGKLGDINCHPLSPLTSSATAAISEWQRVQSSKPQKLPLLLSPGNSQSWSWNEDAPWRFEMRGGGRLMSWPFLILFNSASSPTLLVINLVIISHTSHFSIHIMKFFPFVGRLCYFTEIKRPSFAIWMVLNLWPDFRVVFNSWRTFVKIICPTDKQRRPEQWERV